MDIWSGVQETFNNTSKRHKQDMAIKQYAGGLWTSTSSSPGSIATEHVIETATLDGLEMDSDLAHEQGPLEWRKERS